jgi:hypothetical protein
MNPVFVFLVLLGAVVLWFLLSGMFRLIGGITKYFVEKAKKTMNGEPSNMDAFINGFKDSFKEEKDENK